MFDFSRFMLSALAGTSLTFSVYAQNDQAETASKIDPGVLMLLLTPKSTTTYTVTATSSSGGVLSPAGAVEINEGDVIDIHIMPEWNYEIDDVAGTCGGKLVDKTYTTNSIRDDCIVNVSFKALPAPTSVDVYYIDAGGGEIYNGSMPVFNDRIDFDRYTMGTTQTCYWKEEAGTIYDDYCNPSAEREGNNTAFIRANQNTPICKVGDTFIPKTGYYKETKIGHPEDYNTNCITCTDVRTWEATFLLESNGMLTSKDSTSLEKKIYQDAGTHKTIYDLTNLHVTIDTLDLINKTFSSTYTGEQTNVQGTYEHTNGSPDKLSGSRAITQASGSGLTHGFKGNYKGVEYDFDEFLVFSETLDHVPEDCLSVTTTIVIDQ